MPPAIHSNAWEALRPASMVPTFPRDALVPLKREIVDAEGSPGVIAKRFTPLDPDVLEPAEEFFHDDADLALGEMDAQTVMDAGSEGKMPRLAIDTMRRTPIAGFGDTTSGPTLAQFIVAGGLVGLAAGLAVTLMKKGK